MLVSYGLRSVKHMWDVENFKECDQNKIWIEILIFPSCALEVCETIRVLNEIDVGPIPGLWRWYCNLLLGRCVGDFAMSSICPCKWVCIFIWLHGNNMRTKCLSEQRGKLDSPCPNFSILTDLKICVCVWERERERERERGTRSWLMVTLNIDECSRKKNTGPNQVTDWSAGGEDSNVLPYDH